MRRWLCALVVAAAVGLPAAAQEQDPYPIEATFPNPPDFVWNAPSIRPIDRDHIDRFGNELEAVIAWLQANVVAAGGTGYTTMQDEGTPLPPQPALNFLGGIVSVTDDAGSVRTNVSINVSPGGAAAAVGTTRIIGTTAPLTGGGDLSADRTLAFEVQLANRLFAGPSGGGSAAPTFRALVGSDIPVLDASKITSGVLGMSRGGLGFNAGGIAKGGLLGGTGAGTIGILPTGSNGQVLAVNTATATGLEWSSGAGGGYSTIENAGVAVPQRTTLDVQSGAGGALSVLDVAGETQLFLDVAPPTSSEVVGTDRFVNTFPPLSGGGDLSANRTISFAAQNQNSVFAGPVVGGPVAPSFRPLVDADLPALDASKIATGVLPLARGGLGFNAGGIAKGGLLGGTGAGALGILPTGANGQVLTVDTAAATGLAWATGGGSGGGGYDTVAQFGIPLPQRTLLNIVGGPALQAFDVAGETHILLSQMPSSGAVVGTGRLLNTTAPLTGGGDLTADRTLAFAVQSANTLLAGPTSGAAATPGFRTLVATDVLPGGTTGQVLARDTGAPTGLAWAAGGGGGGLDGVGEANALAVWSDADTLTTAASVHVLPNAQGIRLERLAVGVNSSARAPNAGVRVGHRVGTGGSSLVFAHCDQWRPSTLYIAGECVRSRPPNGYKYIAQTAGQSGSTNPFPQAWMPRRDFTTGQQVVPWQNPSEKVYTVVAACTTGYAYPRPSGDVWCVSDECVLDETAYRACTFDSDCPGEFATCESNQCTNGGTCEFRCTGPGCGAVAALQAVTDNGVTWGGPGETVTDNIGAPIIMDAHNQGPKLQVGSWDNQWGPTFLVTGSTVTGKTQPAGPHIYENQYHILATETPDNRAWQPTVAINPWLATAPAAPGLVVQRGGGQAGVPDPIQTVRFTTPGGVSLLSGGCAHMTYSWISKTTGGRTKAAPPACICFLAGAKIVYEVPQRSQPAWADDLILYHRFLSGGASCTSVDPTVDRHQMGPDETRVWEETGLVMFRLGVVESPTLPFIADYEPVLDVETESQSGVNQTLMTAAEIYTKPLPAHWKASTVYSVNSVVIRGSVTARRNNRDGFHAWRLFATTATQDYCVRGPEPGTDCTIDADCGTGGLCGSFGIGLTCTSGVTEPTWDNTPGSLTPATTTAADGTCVWQENARDGPVLALRAYTDRACRGGSNDGVTCTADADCTGGGLCALGTDLIHATTGWGAGENLLARWASNGSWRIGYGVGGQNDSGWLRLGSLNDPEATLQIEGDERTANGQFGGSVMMQNLAPGGGSAWVIRPGATGTTTPAGGLSFAKLTDYYLDFCPAGSGPILCALADKVRLREEVLISSGTDLANPFAIVYDNNNTLMSVNAGVGSATWLLQEKTAVGAASINVNTTQATLTLGDVTAQATLGSNTLSFAAGDSMSIDDITARDGITIFRSGSTGPGLTVLWGDSGPLGQIANAGGGAAHLTLTTDDGTNEAILLAGSPGLFQLGDFVFTNTPGSNTAKLATADSLEVHGTSGVLRYTNATANSTVATTLGSVGPTGATAGDPVGWVKINVAGTDRYIPFW